MMKVVNPSPCDKKTANSSVERIDSMGGISGCLLESLYMPNMPAGGAIRMANSVERSVRA